MWQLALTVLGVGLIWLYRFNQVLKSVPDEARRLAPRRWTPQDVRDTQERLKQTPIDFLKVIPPKLERRYVIVGGSGQSKISRTETVSTDADQNCRPGWG